MLQKTIGGEKINRICNYANDELNKEVIQESIIFKNVDKRLATFPKFKSTELEKGIMLGKGQFGLVHEITKVNLVNDEVFCEESILDKKRNSEMEMKATEEQDRIFIAKHCIRNGHDARYAVKFLSEEVKSDPDTFFVAVRDLAVEAHFLSTVVHTNIIKMRGMTEGSMCTPNSFIVMDRLYDTLEQRLVKWRRLNEKTKGIKGKLFDKSGKKRLQLLDDRLTAAFDLSAALEYLHSLHIIYRDLKPQNIGFDVRGDVKIFDFGLAKELRQKDKTDNGLYNITGKTGSMIYMAPEVWNDEPYDGRADVYSFAILMWEILFMERPFGGYTAKMVSREIFEKGGRPDLGGTKFSQRLQILLKRAWAHNILERITSKTVTSLLKKELIILRDDENESSMDYTHMRRKSTFVLSRRRVPSGKTSMAVEE